HRRNIQNLKGNQHKAESQKMQLWGRRRDVPRVQSQYQGNKGMSGQRRFHSKSFVSEISEGRAKVEWKAGKLEQEAESHVQANEAAYSKTSHAYRTKGKRITHCLLGSSKRSYFIVERPEEDSIDAPIEIELPESWILFMNGSSCTDGSGAGLILTNPKGAKFTYALRFSFAHLSKQVLVEELKKKSINDVEVLAVVEEEGDTWMTPIYEYLTEETLLAEVNKAKAMRRKSQRFTVINGVLYKKPFLEPWLRCIGTLQVNYVLREIHEGSCSIHAGTRYVVAKALRIGYYWPTMHKDARILIKACKDCQVHRPFPRNPQQKLTPITSPWPFYK
nr:reverse transcriptase domain-containing protein [Tanacetum cinerariifolium]